MWCANNQVFHNNQMSFAFINFISILIEEKIIVTTSKRDGL